MSEPTTNAAIPADAAVPSAAHRRRGFIFLGAAVAGAGFAGTLQLAVNSNFVAQTMGLSGAQQGILEACRESCGIFALVILALLAGLAEPLVGTAMLVVFGLGLATYTVVPNYLWLILASLVWSQGLHVWMPLPNSMALGLAEPGRAGHRLGQMQAAGAAGSGVGLAAALALVLAGVSIRPLYALGGAMAVLGGMACLGIPRAIRTPGPRLIIRRRYGLYYLLSFLEGWRKQIFVAFAGFLLVWQYKTPLWTLIVLWMAIQLITWGVSPLVGRLIDRVGERRMLTIYYVSVTIVFLGYAFVPHKSVLYALYVADSAFFVLAMGLTTYVNRIAPPSEHTRTLSMGVAMNHVAAVIMPLVGGFIWVSLGYTWVFIVGIAAAVTSILVVQRLPSADAPLAATRT